MATIDETAAAILCLSKNFPQFVAKELASLTDNVLTAVQGFTDPLAAVSAINLDSLINDVSMLDPSDGFASMGAVAGGLSTQIVTRELTGVCLAKTATSSAIGKRAKRLLGFSERLVDAGMTMMSLFPDMPFAAAQRMCGIISSMDEVKQKNLSCLRQHVIQLSNSVLVLVENVTDHKDNTISDLTLAKADIKQASSELTISQPVKKGITGFDQNAFERAREALVNASRLLTPDVNGTSILDAVDILTEGSVDSGQVTRENASLAHLVIPLLANLVEKEVAAVVDQVETINFFLASLADVLNNYRRTGNTSRVKKQRSLAIKEIQDRLIEMCAAMELAIERGDVRGASERMLFWSSRVKAMIASMDDLNQLTLVEGSIEGPDKALALDTAFNTLLTDLTAIENTNTVKGVEDPLPLRDKVLSLTKMTRRILKDISNEQIGKNKIATLHKLAAQVALDQVSVIDESSNVAARQILICNDFSSIDLEVKERYETLLSSMRQVGLDRAVDLLSVGKFSEFLESDLDSLSYLGAAVNCLTDAINGTDDIQTRQKIAEIRDGMVAKKSNADLAAADASDSGLIRIVDGIKDQISSLQKNAKTIEAIVGDLKVILTTLGGSLSESFGTVTDFLGNLDRLAVGAGGRLASGLEEISDHPNEGVVLCEPT